MTSFLISVARLFIQALAGVANRRIKNHSKENLNQERRSERMLEKLKAMFQPGPKERTTAAYLAMFAGWAGLHKFYLGYKDVGIIHAALTALGAFVILVQLAGPPGATAVVLVAAILALLGGYFYVGRAYFGLSVAEILSPGRIFLFPWRLVSYVFRLVRVGSNIMDEEEEERRMRRAWRRGGWGRGRRRRGRSPTLAQPAGACDTVPLHRHAPRRRRRTPRPHSGLRRRPRPA